VKSRDINFDALIEEDSIDFHEIKFKNHLRCSKYNKDFMGYYNGEGSDPTHQKACLMIKKY